MSAKGCTEGAYPSEPHTPTQEPTLPPLTASTAGTRGCGGREREHRPSPHTIAPPLLAKRSSRIQQHSPSA
eukprot:6579861-Prymnesium_polylepis.1